MSRNVQQLTSNITIAYGNDHAIGSFLTVYDDRLVNKYDEGIVVDYSELFDYEVNEIGLKPEDFGDYNIIIKKADLFYNKTTNNVSGDKR